MYVSLHVIGKSSGSTDNSFLLSLSNNFNLVQRDLLKFLEMAIELVRVTLERRKIPQTS